MCMTLDRLEPGAWGRVEEIDMPSEQAMSLTRLGLCPGTHILCLRRTPLADPTVYRFRGTDVALRKRDAAKIKVTRGQ